MKKTTYTVIQREECPNCGAPRDSDASFCKFCGTSLLSGKRVIEDVDPTLVEKKTRKLSADKPDIISTVVPVSNFYDVKWKMKSGIIFGGSFLLAFLAAGTVYAGDGSADAIVKVFTVIAVIGVVCTIVYAVSAGPNTWGQNYIKSGQLVKARVLQFGELRREGEASWNRKNYLTVAAEIEGREQVVQLIVSDRVTRNTYEPGSVVWIIGREDTWLLASDIGA